MLQTVLEHYIFEVDDLEINEILCTVPAVTHSLLMQICVFGITAGKKPCK